LFRSQSLSHFLVACLCTIARYHPGSNSISTSESDLDSLIFLLLTILPIVSSLPVLLFLRNVVAYLWGASPLQGPYCRIIRFSSQYLLFPLQKTSVNSSSSLGNLSYFLQTLSYSSTCTGLSGICGRISYARDSRPGYSGHGVSYPPRLADYQAPSCLRRILILPASGFRLFKSMDGCFPIILRSCA
jgi:hypothetical protein